MAAEGGGETTSASRSLQNTPTWALATVCFIFISSGLLVEHLIHLLGHWLKKHRKKAMLEAFEKLKSVLILLGFLSLLLAVTQRPIAKICIPTRIAYTMLPCRKGSSTKTIKAVEHILTHTFQNSLPEGVFESSTSRHERGLADEDEDEAKAKANESNDYCGSKEMTSLISEEGINQLSIFIFVLAVMQIVYSVATMALGRLKMRHWKAWEKETQTVEYMAANDPNRFRFIRQTTFGKRHMSSCATTSTQLWIKCFFRQFFHSVAKVDYLTLRHGFIAAHLSSTNNTFNFQKYIQRSLEDDFRLVVGIRPFMWLLVVIFLLVDVHGWHVYLWVSFLPLTIVLVLGTKLEVIVARMAVQLTDQTTVIRGSPLVRPNDNLFWFNHPNFVLTLLHLTLFMNAFELAFFVWVTSQFGFKSCYHESIEIIVIRLVLAVMVQVLCSYITLPLYALVTQMGSHFKSAVLEEETVHAIRKWHAEVRDKRKKQPFSVSPRGGDESSTPWSTSRSNSMDLSSSHRRTPSLSEFTYRTGGSTEIIQDSQNDEIVQEHVQRRSSPPTVSSMKLQVGMTEITNAPSI